MVNLAGDPQAGDKVIEHFLCSGSGQPVLCAVCLCISCKMINYDKYIFISCTTGSSAKNQLMISSNGAEEVRCCNGAVAIFV